MDYKHKYLKYKYKYINFKKKNIVGQTGGYKWDTTPINMEKNPKEFSAFDFNKCAIYYVNLEKSTDRRNYMELLFKKENLNVNRFEAIDAEKIKLEDYDKYLQSIPNRYHEPDMKTHFINNPKTKGNFGCYLSHLGIMEEFLKTDKEYLMVFEDDSILCDNFQELVNQRVKYVPDDWELLLLGYQIVPGSFYMKYNNANDNIPIKNGYLSIVTFTGTYGMLIKRHCVEKLLKLLVPMDWYIDHHITALAINKKIKIYGLVNPLVITYGNSTITTNIFSYKYNSQHIPAISTSTINKPISNI